ncbi:Ail/Lom family outer membrane beta-barrel protein [Cedecea colo]|uniref:Ail/Lom family protein n=1 Tax=Cedecea colo TaxID=2552946 RepID=A0ABX0VM18_9ENTR|nr:Ail/Lom family outer membrane beta-barrel protein [Cedecea colo]NIY48084.1 Ail/Lom family protein [Cedecea colo]
MKKTSLAVLLATTMVSGIAVADNHTASVGYAQSKVQDFKNIHGVNIQYRYETNSPLSLLASLSYMKGDNEQNYLLSGDAVNNRFDIKYYSLLAGPAYRINDYVSLYALGGLAHVKASGKTRWTESDYDYVGQEGISEKSTDFAYGFGIIINPVDKFSINVGYEGTQIKADGNHSINGFNVGVGYRF